MAFEVLQRERSKDIKPKIVQFLALIAGFATMMTVDLLSKLKMTKYVNVLLFIWLLKCGQVAALLACACPAERRRQRGAACCYLSTIDECIKYANRLNFNNVYFLI